VFKAFGPHGPPQEVPFENADASLGLGAAALQAREPVVFHFLAQDRRRPRTQRIERAPLSQRAAVGCAVKTPVRYHRPHIAARGLPHAKQTAKEYLAVGG